MSVQPLEVLAVVNDVTDRYLIEQETLLDQERAGQLLFSTFLTKTVQMAWLSGLSYERMMEVIQSYGEAAYKRLEETEKAHATTEDSN